MCNRYLGIFKKKDCSYLLHSLWTISSGGSKGGARNAHPRGPNSFNFMQFFGKIWQNRMLAPPGGLVPPPRGNPGSAIDQLTCS